MDEIITQKPASLTMPAFQRLMALAALVLMADVFITLHRHCVDAGLQIRVTDLYDPFTLLTFIKLVVYAAGVVGVSVLLSHRIAGPLFRFLFLELKI